MDRLSKLDRDELVRQMREDFQATMLEVADAVNDAPQGHLIDGSQEQVSEPPGMVWDRVRPSRCARF